jgi:phosphatidylglycerol:prolipoprotein diacylglycerol transferase
MLQTLFYIPGELFGVPVFGFGLLLAVCAVASAILLAMQIRRGGFNAVTIGYLQVLAVLGFAIYFILPAICEPRGLPIRGYGMMMLLAVLSGMGLAIYRARRVGVDPEMIFALAFWMIIPGILGARIFFVTQYWRDDFWPIYERTHEISSLVFAVVNVAAGGLVVYGSFVGAMLGLGLFWWRNRIPLLATADLIAPSMLLGLALGRVGCMLNGCCYGGPCNLPWSVTFPWNSPVDQQEVVEEGSKDVAGLRFKDGPGVRPVIESVGSPADKAGLKAGDEVIEINGSTVTSARDARSVALGIDKLDLKLFDEYGMSKYRNWLVDDPPEAQVAGDGPVKIFGLEIVDGYDKSAMIGRVRRGSPEDSANITAGQRVVNVSGRAVENLEQLRSLLIEHRKSPWLLIRVAAQPKPILVSVDRPLPRSLPVHPTQLYSSIDALILCFLLLAVDPFRRRDGVLAALMMTVEPITRFLIEGIRTDEAAIWGTPFTISQNISLAFLAVAVGLWIYVLRQPPKLAFAESGQ